LGFSGDTDTSDIFQIEFESKTTKIEELTAEYENWIKTLYTDDSYFAEIQNTDRLQIGIFQKESELMVVTAKTEDFIVTTKFANDAWLSSSTNELKTNLKKVFQTTDENECLITPFDIKPVEKSLNHVFCAEEYNCDQCNFDCNMAGKYYIGEYSIFIKFRIQNPLDDDKISRKEL
jgi:hypothetical protein